MFEMKGKILMPQTGRTFHTNKLGSKTHKTGISLNYWDPVILAEAKLLLGKLAESRNIYNEASENHSEDAENILATHKQAGLILEEIGLSYSTDDFFNAGPELTSACICVHRWLN